MESSAPVSVTTLLILASTFTLFPLSPPGQNACSRKEPSFDCNNRFNKIWANIHKICRKYFIRTATCTWRPANLFMIPGRHISRDSIIFFSPDLLQAGVQLHYHHGLVANLLKEVLTYYMMASRVIPGNRDNLIESLASEFFTQHCWWIQAGQWSPNLDFLSRSGRERLLRGYYIRTLGHLSLTLIF